MYSLELDPSTADRHSTRAYFGKLMRRAMGMEHRLGQSCVAMGMYRGECDPRCLGKFWGECTFVAHDDALPR